jgi:hypothetical protein
VIEASLRDRPRDTGDRHDLDPAVGPLSERLGAANGKKVKD